MVFKCDCNDNNEDTTKSNFDCDCDSNKSKFDTITPPKEKLSYTHADQIVESVATLLEEEQDKLLAENKILVEKLKKFGANKKIEHYDVKAVGHDARHKYDVNRHGNVEKLTDIPKGLTGMCFNFFDMWIF